MSIRPGGPSKADLSGTYSRAGVLPNRLVVTGDSITAANSDNVNKVQADSWATHLGLNSSGALQLVANAGHGGYTSAQLLALFSTEVAALAPTLVGISVGRNDPLDGSNLPTATATNVKAMVAQAKAAGAAVFLTTVPPTGTAALGTPAAPTLATATTGGTLAAGTYSYRIAATNLAGTTLASVAATIVVPGGTSTNTVTITAPMVAGATGYKFYGRVGGSELLIGTQTASGSSHVSQRAFTDTGSVTPSGAVPGSDTTAVAIAGGVRLQTAAINAWTKRYAALNSIPLVDFYGLLVDPVTGMYQTGFTRDGTHPTPTQQAAMGLLAWNTLKAMVSPVVPLVAQDSTDPMNIASNACFSTGTASLPSGWNSYSGAATGFTDVLGAKAGFAGQAYQAGRSVADDRSHDGPAYATGFSAGDRILLACRVQTESSAAGGLQATYTLRGFGSNIDIAKLILSACDVGPGTWVEEFVVPASTTGLGLRAPYLARGTGVASLGQVTLINLTTGSLITA